ncbi:MAG: hypothetical protein B7Z66_01385 [Chromatiales bacterium 21-64-14]|nr:MAG: hypothetical protein B7Z66_01385 [Chromatiales bacterium 21-64-14]HQU14866.1 peptidoglycan editing factor PgeF [Gammaproteobacteria bacterium]
MQEFAYIVPDWPAPPSVGAAVTTRQGGVSVGPYRSLNLGDRVGDDPRAVAENRARVMAALALPAMPDWLEQCHGTRVLRLPADARDWRADAAWTADPGVVCAVLTADCLPVLLCDRAGTRVAAVHAGWRGLAAGVVEAAVAALATPGRELLAWLGPAIGPSAFEVGDEVRQGFLAPDSASADAFRPSRPGHWHADLSALARRRLTQCGVEAAFGGDDCTYREANRFFSYRRDRVTGRMAALIWIRPAVSGALS